jgi:hypothetical protein
MDCFFVLIASAFYSLYTCGEMDKVNYDTLNQVRGMMTNPFKTFRVSGKNILLNGKNVNAQANNVVEAWRNKDYLNMERNIGITFTDVLDNKKDTLFLF